MTLIVPDYYQEFACIADKCKHSCCIEWEVDVDEASFEYYTEQEGRFGDRLRENMYLTEDGDHRFVMRKNGRCPFLNDNDFCDIFTELGEAALCEVCTEYPRFSIYYGNKLLKGMSLSCEEVVRILFRREEPVTFVEMEMPYDNDDMENGEDFDQEWVSHLEELQNMLITILQDRSKDIWTRIRLYLEVGELAKQQLLVDEVWEPEKIRKLVSGKILPEYERNYAEEFHYEAFLARYSMLQELEILDMEWNETLEQFKLFSSARTYVDILNKYSKSNLCKDIDYEQLMVYYTFRSFMNAVYDFDFVSYMKMAVTFTLIIRDIHAIRFHINGNQLERPEYLDHIRALTKEVEHSEDNFQSVREEMLFEEAYELQKLAQQI